MVTGYLLTKKEGRTGSPEKPLSGLGAVSYKYYWKLSVFRYLSTAQKPVSFEDVSKGTSMTLDDILKTLVNNDFITIRDAPAELAKKRKRAEKQKQHAGGGVARQALSRGNQTTGMPDAQIMPEDYTIHWDQAQVEAFLGEQDRKPHYRLKPEKLKYTPFLVQRLVLGKDGMVEAESVAKARAVEVQGEEPALGPSVEVPQGATLPDGVQPPADEGTEVAVAEVAEDVQADVDMDVGEASRPTAALALAEEESEEVLMDEMDDDLPRTPKRQKPNSDDEEYAEAEPVVATPPRRTGQRRNAQRTPSVAGLSVLSMTPGRATRSRSKIV